MHLKWGLILGLENSHFSNQSTHIFSRWLLLRTGQRCWTTMLADFSSSRLLILRWSTRGYLKGRLYAEKNQSICIEKQPEETTTLSSPPNRTRMRLAASWWCVNVSSAFNNEKAGEQEDLLGELLLGCGVGHDEIMDLFPISLFLATARTNI